MENENSALLNGIYKTTSIGMEATKLIFSNVKDRHLRRQVAQQYFDYKTTSHKVKNLLHYNGGFPQHEDNFKKAMIRSSIRLNTIMNKKPEHIAELMITGTAMGIIDVNKKLNRFDGADTEVKKMAEDFLTNEQRNIDELKRHL